MKRTLAHLALLGPALLLAASCRPGAPPVPTAGPAGPAETTPRPTEAAAASVTGPTAPDRLTDNKVVIGVINDQSLVYADLSGTNGVKAAQLAVDDFELRYGKGSLGGPIEVVSADHQNRADLATAKAQEFYDRLGVDLILDVPTPSTALAVASVAKDKKKLYINVSGATTELTGAQCNRYTYQYAYDTWMLARGTGTEVTKAGGKRWYILYPNYAYGQDMDRSFQAAIRAAGGEIAAADASPFPNPGNDFAPFLLKAPSLKADVLGVMNVGGELVNVVKQYNELKLKDQGVKLAIGLLFDTDIRSPGADAFAGALYTTPWFWNLDARAREWSERYTKYVGGARPTFAQAGNYSATTQYLEALRRAGTDNADDVVRALDGQTIDDFFIRNGRIRPEDHAVVHDAYLAQVKLRSEMKEDGDFSKLVSTIPADQAFRSVQEARAAGCSMP